MSTHDQNQTSDTTDEFHRYVSEQRDIESIKQLKARYFRLMDTKQFAAMAEVFVEAGLVTDSRDAGGHLQTTTNVEYARYLEKALKDVVTIHHGHTPEITITSSTTAEGIWAMEDDVHWPNGRRLHGAGHYLETYEKTSAGWRIKTLTLTRLFQEITPPQAT